MAKFTEHPTVRGFYEKTKDLPEAGEPSKLDTEWLRNFCLELGADDVGFVSVDRPELDPQRHYILRYAPQTKSLISFVCRLNRTPIRSTARSLANLEFHHVGDEVNEVSRKIVAALEAQGVRAINPSMGFPMEMALYPERIWVVAHKPVAAAAGLGHMGIHRCLIHPRFGSFVLLGTVLIDREVTSDTYPIDYNPCFECNLCVASCPVGAIGSDGTFNFSACYTHNYREFMGGFTDWVEQIADSKNALDYRKRMSEPETASMWQSLSYGANYKSAYCLGVCPAGEDVIGPFLTDRKGYLEQVVKPLQDKEETAYVIAGSDAEAYVKKRFKNKTPKQVGNGLRPRTIRALLDGLPHVFEKNQSEGLDATYHFTFTGQEERQATIVIRNKTLGRRWARGCPEPPRHRRYPNVARVSRERTESGVGLGHAEDPVKGSTQALGGLWQVLPDPLVSACPCDDTASDRCVARGPAPPDTFNLGLHREAAEVVGCLARGRRPGRNPECQDLQARQSVRS